MRSPGTPEHATVGRLKRRADFLRAAKGRRWHGAALSLQAAVREGADAGSESGSDLGSEPGSDLKSNLTMPPRVGFTLTKKVGCAVVRNRARRRLREAVRLSPDLPLRPGHDYVLVGRLEAIRLPFEAVRDELARAVGAVGAAPRAGKGARRAGPRDAGDGRTRPKP